MNNTCRQCGTKTEENAKFCPQCGVSYNDGLPSNNEFVPTIEVLRDSSFVGCLLSYRVLIDGQEIGRLKNGEKKRFQFEPGLHEMYIKVNWSWFSSPKESFLLKDFVKFSCSPKVGIIGSIIKMPYYLFFKRNKFIELKQF